MAAKLTDQEFTKGMQVFVLPNLYGDIVTDVAAEYQAAWERLAPPISATNTPV